MMSGKDFLKSHVLKGVFRLERCYIFRQGVPGLWDSDQESTATDSWSLDRWHQKTIGASRTKRLSARKTAYWHERSKVQRCTSVKASQRHMLTSVTYWMTCDYQSWLGRFVRRSSSTLADLLKASNTRKASSFQVLCRSPDGLASDDEPTSYNAQTVSELVSINHLIIPYKLFFIYFLFFNVLIIVALTQNV